MGCKRIESAKIDLGEMASEILHLDNDRERSEWLIGFSAGLARRSKGLGWSVAKTAGYNFGLYSLD